MNRSIVAENTKRIIAERGYKQRAVAKIAGYNEKTFSNLLNGRKIITAEDIVAISDALGVTPNNLFGIDNFSTKIRPIEPLFSRDDPARDSA